MSNIPEIRINLAWLLLYGESKTLAGDKKLLSQEEYEEKTAAYKKEWRKYENKILPALQQALGVEFYRPVIDVSCAPFFVPKSDPLIMSFYYEPDQFVDVLTHELCHVLLTDNNKVQINADNPSMDTVHVWQKLFGRHEFNTLVHIPVHALSKYVYLDVLKEPNRLERDIKQKFPGHEAYDDAWEYVNSHDYKKVISDLKNLMRRSRHES